jgi:hypothetical protein
MSTDMRGIFQSNIFSQAPAVSVVVPRDHRYRALAESLPWVEMAEIANKYRSQKVDIDNGRPLDLRLHLGAYAAQAMSNWTDRETEDMVRCHGGVRVLCGVEGSDATLDHTSIEQFRNALGKDGAQELNRVGVQAAASFGFTGPETCSADTTVQEAPIEHPTEVGHLKKMAEKLAAIAAKMTGAVAKKAESLAKGAVKIFKNIRLSVRGKTEAAIKAKKQLSMKLHDTLGRLLDVVGDNFASLPQKARAKAEEKLNLFNHIHEQIKVWLETGFHPKDKILSLWDLTSRAIVRGKLARATEFGRRWIVTRLARGYVIGSQCLKIGADADVKIADEVLIEFLNTFGKLPETYVFDRGGNGPENREILDGFGIEDCTFGSPSAASLSKKTKALGRRERALSEAAIALIKHNRYGFNRPRARSTDSCTLKGHAAMCGFNLNRLAGDLIKGSKLAGAAA